MPTFTIVAPRRMRLGAALAFGFALLDASTVAGAEPHAAEPSASRRAGGAEPLPLNAADTGASRSFASIRYLEDYAHLAHVHERVRYERIKYIPLGSGVYLSIGGQHRLRYELLDPVALGVGESGTEGERGVVGAGRVRESILLSRNLLHVDLHLGPELRVFGQLGGFYVLGEPSAKVSPPDADDADVTQLFLESRAKLGALAIVTRVGRQEMSLGSTRWVGTRDGTNLRQAFDLVRSTVTYGRATTSLSVEVFFGTVPAPRRGAFDDAPAWSDGFWGVHATTALRADKRLGLETYYLGRRRASADYEGEGKVVTARDVRHTFGMRLFGETSFGLQAIGHAMMQTGTFGDANVAAWAFAGGLWQTLPLPLETRLGFRADALSGDGAPGRGHATTFHPLFPNQTFFSALPAIYPTNLYDLHPLVRVGRGPLELEGGCAFFWRQSSADAIYAPPGDVLVSGRTTTARYTGAQASLSFVYRADRHLAINTEYAHLFAGPAIEAAGGSAVDFFGTWTTYTY